MKSLSKQILASELFKAAISTCYLLSNIYIPYDWSCHMTLLLFINWMRHSSKKESFFLFANYSGKQKLFTLPDRKGYESSACISMLPDFINVLHPGYLHLACATSPTRSTAIRLGQHWNFMHFCLACFCFPWSFLKIKVGNETGTYLALLV